MLNTEMPECPALHLSGRYQRGLEWAVERLRRQGMDESAVQSALRDLTRPCACPRAEGCRELQLGAEPDAGRAGAEAPAVRNGHSSATDHGEEPDKQPGPRHAPQAPNGLAECRGADPAPLSRVPPPAGAQQGPSAEFVLVEEAQGDASEAQEAAGGDVSRRAAESDPHRLLPLPLPRPGILWELEPSGSTPALAAGRQGPSGRGLT